MDRIGQLGQDPGDVVRAAVEVAECRRGLLSRPPAHSSGSESLHHGDGLTVDGRTHQEAGQHGVVPVFDCADRLGPRADRPDERLQGQQRELARHLVWRF